MTAVTQHTEPVQTEQDLMDPETARGGRAMDKIQIDDVDKAGEDNVKIDLNMQSSPSPTTARGGQGDKSTPM